MKGTHDYHEPLIYSLIFFRLQGKIFDKQEFSLSFDYNRLINYIDNSMVFYYSLDSGWYLTNWWQLNLGYILYVDEDKNEFSYYSSGISFSF